MVIKNVRYLLAVAATIALAGCGDHQPGDATGSKVLSNIIQKNGVGAKIVSFKKVQGREVKHGNTEAFELQDIPQLQRRGALGCHLDQRLDRPKQNPIRRFVFPAIDQQRPFSRVID